MSWLNPLNDSLNKMKSILAEGIEVITEERHEEPEISKEEHENLQKILEVQNEEITILRKQIFEYQQEKLNDISNQSKSLIAADSLQQSTIHNVVQAVPSVPNDSWFWEPDNSSSSSKRDDNGSPESGEIDLTTIPLDGCDDHELIERLRKQVIERDVKLKSIGVENSILNEKLKNLSLENQELNKNIDELDKQHQVAIEKVLDVKSELQDKYNCVQEENRSLLIENSDIVKEKEDDLKDIVAAKESLEKQLEQLTASKEEITKYAQQYEQQIAELSADNLKYETEVVNLQEKIKSLQEKDDSPPPELVVKNDESLIKINSCINEYFKLNGTFENEDQFVECFEKWALSTSEKLSELNLEYSKLMNEHKMVKDESAKYSHEKEVLKADLINYEIECSELMKNNNILMTDIENLKCGAKLETIQETEDEENFGMLERQLEDSNSLNQCLEDEFHQIRSRLESTESEKEEYLSQISQLKNQLTENVSRCKNYQEEIDNLENEKCNYLFELNELKSEDERNILQRELKSYKDKEVELSKQLLDLLKDHDILQEKYDKLEIASKSQLKKLEVNFNEMQEVKESLATNFEELQKEHYKLTESLKDNQVIIQNLEQKLQENAGNEELSVKISSLEESINGLTKEKEDLISLVTTKHNENVQYHNEIIRLNQMLSQESTNKNQQHSIEVEQLNDQIQFLREKSEILAQNLMTEQNNQRLLQQEKNDVAEQNSTLNKDIERLRQHLLEVADAYTFEQVSLQKQVEDYKSKLMSIEDEVKKSTTQYTSANIRANQQAETLQTQYTLLLQQREELLSKINSADDHDSKNQAALTNLQSALEIFQRDKERDIELRTAHLLKELNDEKFKQSKMSQDINQLQQQLQEAKNGLLAAARLNDQLEMNQMTIQRLNSEMHSYQENMSTLKKQLEESKANTSSADMDLVKNLVIGYITAPNAEAKSQILKLISNVLSLNDMELARVGLKTSNASGGWFSLLGGGNENANNNNVSLTEAFVAFLEKESQPRVNNPNLLTIHEKDASVASRKSSIVRPPSEEHSTLESTSQDTSITAVHPILLGDSQLLPPYENRNSSTILKDLLNDP
ncbi:unnamed protein product [Diamesa hyperborea]